jgi:3-methylcrotonyl-CoA carboxylase alpha subunit
MEHTIAAPGPGLVVEVRYAVGDQVEDGIALVVFEAD